MISPPTIQAAKTRAAVPTARAMSLVTRKIPVPIVSLITIAVADHKPRPRIKSDCRSVRLALVALTKVARAYYPGFIGSINFVYNLAAARKIWKIWHRSEFAVIIEPQWPGKFLC